MKYKKINPLTNYELLEIELKMAEINEQLEVNSENEILLNQLDYLIETMEASVYWNKRSKFQVINGGKNEN